ncbi:MAG: DUF4350 domain-containing protein [Acidobacteriaceae bacterium]
MRLLAGIDHRDKTLLLSCAALVAILILLLALFSPGQNNEDLTPSSYSTAPHGAKAAFELLRQSGYRVERQSDSLTQIEDRVDEHTTVVFADPFLANVNASREAVKALLDKGARIVVTGYAGGLLAPGNAVEANRFPQSECNADGNGFGPLAGSGMVRMTPSGRWKQSNPLHQVAYSCQGDAVAVTYKAGKGTVIWWAGALPLENSGLQQADNLVFFLNSIGPPATTHVFWDESLHGDSPSLLSYARGTPLDWIGWQLVLVVAFLLWSYARRSGPLRPDPVVPRTTQIEFVHSLGSLYQAAGANQVAVSGAYRHFRQQLEQRFAISANRPAEALGGALSQHFGAGGEQLLKTLVACEQAIEIENLPAKTALERVQALHDCDDFIHRQMRHI